MHKGYLVIATLLAAAAVILGAFGAHRLSLIADKEIVESYSTGVQYQFYHVFALFITAILSGHYHKRLTGLAGFFFLAGIFFFSGSLYVITALKISGSSIPSVLRILTPSGGVFFISGWILLLLAILKK